MTILELSGIASYCLSGSHGTIQTQMQPPEDIWRTAAIFEKDRTLRMSCTKWVFCFRPHGDGGYEHVPRNSPPILLDAESSKLMKKLVQQYRELKRGC